MSAENIVFRKIKEISIRGIHPRPSIAVLQISKELFLTSDSLSTQLTELKRLRLVTYCGNGTSSVRLTLLGSVVNRDK